jgi:cell division protein FtsW
MSRRQERATNPPQNLRQSRTSLAPERPSRASRSLAPEPSARARARSVNDRPSRTSTESPRNSKAPSLRVSSPSVRLSTPNARVSKAPEPVVEPRSIITGPFDPVLCAVIWALVFFGVVMVYSASAVHASQNEHGDGTRYLLRQGLFALGSLPLMHLVARFDYHRLRTAKYPLLIVTVGLLCFVAFGLGHSAGGSARWIKLGPIHVQPVEIAKIVWVCMLADSLSRKTARIRSFSIGFLPHVIGAGILAKLCLMQPDFGSAVMIVLITFCMLFAAGARFGYLLVAGLAALPIVYHLVKGSEYRMRRWEAFMKPFEHRQDAGYQLWESMMGFGAGGMKGVGLGYSRQKLLFLPEAHTDFISAIIGEELGFIGFIALAIVFAVLIARGLRAALRSVDEFGTYLAIGLTLLVGIQALTNLAVAVGLLPTKGLVLPFISYGGSSLVMNCIAMGIVLNVSRPRISVADAALGGARTKPELEGLGRSKLQNAAGGVS